MRETDGRKLTQRDQEADRLRAARLLRAGKSAEEVAQIFSRSRAWAFGVQKVLRERGMEGLEAKPRPEGPKKVDGRQSQEVFRMIRDHTPDDYGFDTALWIRPIVGDLIYEQFGVDVSLPTVGKILRGLGLSPQRPTHRAIQQNPEAVRQWQEEEFPKIRDEARREGAELWFSDEAAVRSDYHTGTTWAPVGQTPVVRSTGDRGTVSMLSAITTKGAGSFEVRTGTVNSEVYIEFLKKLLQDAAGRKVHLIIDRATYHTSKITAKFVESTEGQLKLFFLPSYCRNSIPMNSSGKTSSTTRSAGLRSRTMTTSVHERSRRFNV